MHHHWTRPPGMTDLEDLEDQWIEGEKTELDIYQRFQYHGLNNQAIEPVRKVVDGWLLDLRRLNCERM